MFSSTQVAPRPHGYARYKLDNCRCYVCGFAASEYRRDQIARVAAGTWSADIEPVRVHIRSLMAAGMGYRRIAARAHISNATIARILYGYRGRPRSRTTMRYDPARRILAVDLDLAPGSPVEATGTGRRIRALIALGHTESSIAREIGWTTQNLSRIVHRSQTPHLCRVTRRTAMTVARLYDRWSMTRPEGGWADQARARAAQQGWPPPLAWDDDEIDDPVAQPATTTTNNNHFRSETFNDNHCPIPQPRKPSSRRRGPQNT